MYCKFITVRVETIETHQDSYEIEKQVQQTNNDFLEFSICSVP